ncbi:hypothetical protein FRC09_002638 [Ceratobasidium sp. 395]|nr:hypothetical protein FRC09_002638 [Ceratobasidium sp. 395]
MSHVKHIHSPLPDFRPLLQNLRPPPDPNPQPLLDLTPLTEAIQTTGHILILFLYEVFNTGSELFQIGSTACDWILVKVNWVLVQVKWALVKIDWVLVEVLVVLVELSWYLWVVCWFAELWFWIVVWIVRRVGWWYGRVLRHAWGKVCRRVGGKVRGCLCGNLNEYQEYSKAQEWEPPRSETPATEVEVIPDPLDWFSGHPVPCEAYPTPTSRRQWNFSYSKKVVIELPTPPTTPIKKSKKRKCGQREDWMMVE